MHTYVSKDYKLKISHIIKTAPCGLHHKELFYLDRLKRLITQCKILTFNSIKTIYSPMWGVYIVSMSIDQCGAPPHQG